MNKLHFVITAFACLVTSQKTAFCHDVDKLCLPDEMINQSMSTIWLESLRRNKIRSLDAPVLIDTELLPRSTSKPLLAHRFILSDSELINPEERHKSRNLGYVGLREFGYEGSPKWYEPSLKIRSWFQKAEKQIERFRTDNKSPTRDWRASCTFKVTSLGYVSDPKFYNGDREIEEQILATLKRTSPLPVPPKCFGAEQRLIAHFTFNEPVDLLVDLRHFDNEHQAALILKRMALKLYKKHLTQ